MLRRIDIKTKNGFTLIETLSAIFIILIGLVSGLSLITQTISFMSLASSKLVASYLTQEGIEIVRNIRDNNWLIGLTGPGIWKTNIDNGDRQAGYNDLSLNNYNSNDRLLIDSATGLYSYDSGGVASKFQRKISINQGADGLDERIKVTVSTEWEQKGKLYSVSAQEYLYNWR